MWRNGVGIVLKLVDTKRDGKELVVGNTHLFWDPAFKDVKLAQIEMMLEVMKKASKNFLLPSVLCGDLNSLPDSEVYAAITENYQSAYKVVDGAEPQFTNFTPVSTDGVEERERKELSFTMVLTCNITAQTFKGTLDYIFFADGEESRIR